MLKDACFYSTYALSVPLACGFQQDNLNSRYLLLQHDHGLNYQGARVVSCQALKYLIYHM